MIEHRVTGYLCPGSEVTENPRFTGSPLSEGTEPLVQIDFRPSDEKRVSRYKFCGSILYCTDMPMESVWNLHLQRWVIEDGEPELHVGDVFDWPLTFWVDEMLMPAVERTKVASPLVGNYYRVNAEVIYISQDLNQAGCILDFGMQAISELGGLLGVPLPSDCKEGDYVTGKIRLDLALCTVVHPHDLTRKWRVNGISADLTDYSSKPGDISRPCYQEVSSTDGVWAGSYVLRCSAVELMTQRFVQSIGLGVS
jgi:hypothetical protein